MNKQTDTTNVEAASVSTINEVFTHYYNDGVYRKDTQIYVDSELVKADFFHAGHISLERITYYEGDKLWMTNKAGTGNSGYGTSTNGNLTQFKKDSEGNIIDEVEVASLPGMEEYYLTLHDFVEGTHNSAHSENQDLDLASGWTYANGVYTNNRSDLIEGFRLFTAPLFLKVTEEYSNYFSFSHVTVEVQGKNLVMSLYVDADNKGVMTSEKVDGHYLFSQAIIANDEGFIVEAPDLTYTGTYTGTAAYDNKTGTYSVDLNFNQWNRIEFTYDGKLLNIDNTNIVGNFVGKASAPYNTNLYTENGSLLLTSNTVQTPYRFVYNPSTNTLEVIVKGFSYSGEYYNGFIAYEEGKDSYSFELLIGQWKYVNLSFNGVSINTGNTNFTGALGTYNEVSTSSNAKYKGLYENSTGSFMSAIGAVNIITYTPSTNTVNIEVKEVSGLYVYGNYSGSYSETLIKPNSDGTYSFNITFVPNGWKHISFVYNGTVIKTNVIDYSKCTDLLYSDSAHNYRVYITGIKESKTFKVTFDPQTMKVTFTKA